MGLRAFISSLPVRTSGPVTGGFNIESVADQDDVITTVGTPPTLPTTVLVTYDNASTELVGVSWSSVIDEVGHYTLEGIILLASPNTNDDDVKAAVNVIIDNVAANGSDFLYFDGISNFIRYGDYLDSLWAAASPYFEIEFTMKNVPLTGTGRFLSKAEVTGNQRAFIYYKSDNDVTFVWYTLGTTARLRAITWADCLPDTDEHTLKLTYDGTISSNNGLDRVELYLDGVLVTSGKSVSTSAGTIGPIFNSTAQLSFGNLVNAAGQISTDTTTWFKGDLKDLIVRSSGGTVELSGLSIPRTVSHGTYRKYEQPIYNGSKDSTAYDSCQSSNNGMAVIGSNHHLYVLASNPLLDADRDVTTLAIKTYNNTPQTGWVKQLTSGTPTIVYNVGSTGKYDAKQSWLRNVLRNAADTGYIAFPIGQSAVNAFAMGKATSSDGISWTRANSGDPVYTDGTTDITIAHIVRDEADGKLKGVYCGNQYGVRLRAIESSDDGDTWTVTHSNFLLGESLGWVIGYQIIDGVHYMWFDRAMKFFSQISREIALYTTEDFSTFQYHGPQIVCRGGTEFGLASAGNVCFRLPDNRWGLAFTMYKEHVGKSANLGEEFTAVKVAVLNRTDVPIASKACVFDYPDYVVEHYPLNQEEQDGTYFNEFITGGTATINSTPVYTPDAAFGNRTLGFVDLNGSQNITNSTAIEIDAMDFSDFAIKLRVEIVTTGTHELFRIGDAASNRSIIITLESGKLRVRISADGSTWAKDWITTANISKPASMSYIDNHIYVGVIFAGGTMTLYNDFVAFTGGQLTKTTDGAITTMYYTNGARVIGNNATLEMRSVSILSGATSAEFIDLEL
jgi:hypothetical protein